MCGIIGFITNNLAHNSCRPRFIEQALYVGAVRGWDSTGLYTVEKDNKVFYSKDAVDSQQFLSTPGALNYIKKVNSGVHAAIGHNRWATNGGHGVEAAHPFVTAHVVLVHNGTLRNYNHLPAHEDAKVDSARLAQALSEARSGGKSVLENLHGAYALVWHDNRTDCIYIARNDERPLHYAIVKENLYIASEGKMLEWLLGRLDISPTASATLFPQHIIHRWSLKGTKMVLNKPNTTPYTPPKPPVYKKTSEFYKGGKHQSVWWDYSDSPTSDFCSSTTSKRSGGTTYYPSKTNPKKGLTDSQKLVNRALKDYNLKIRHGDIIEAWGGDLQPYAGKPRAGRCLGFLEDDEIDDISTGGPFPGQIYVDIHNVPIPSAEALHGTVHDSYYCEIVGIAARQDEWMSKEDLLLTGIFKEVAARNEGWKWINKHLKKMFKDRRYRYTFNDTSKFDVLDTTLTNREFDMWVKDMKCFDCKTPASMVARDTIHVTKNGKSFCCGVCRDKQNKVVPIK